MLGSKATNEKEKMKRYTNSKNLKEDIKSGRIKDGEMILIDKRKIYADRINLIRTIIGVVVFMAWLLI